MGKISHNRFILFKNKIGLYSLNFRNFKSVKFHEAIGVINNNLN